MECKLLVVYIVSICRRSIYLPTYSQIYNVAMYQVFNEIVYLVGCVPLLDQKNETKKFVFLVHKTIHTIKCLRFLRIIFFYFTVNQ